MSDRQWHALVIGIDRYPAFPKDQLSGCVNDASAMRRFLSERVLVPEANLRCLTSPRDPAAGTESTAATAANIRAEFGSLLNRVQAGDHVVMFYAGHGFQVAVDVAGAKQRYYGFVAQDVVMEGKGYANLILGSEVHALLRSLEQKGATATVIADTCHSGASTRAIEQDPRERVLRLDDLTGAQARSLSEHHPALQSTSTAGERGGADTIKPFGAYPGSDYVMLTGCLDSETSKEDSAPVVGEDGSETTATHGLMTLALMKELEAMTPDSVRSLRWMDFYERLRRVVARRTVDIGASRQTVSLEGRRERTVFGGEWKPFAPGFTVRTSDGAIRIDGGDLHGLSTGAVVAIYPPDTTDFENATIPAVSAIVDASTPMTSTLKLADGAAIPGDLSRARLVRPSPAVTPIVVRVSAAEGMPVSLRQAIDRQLDSSRDVVITGDQPGAITPAHAELRRWSAPIPPGVWPSPETFAAGPGGWILVRTDQFGSPSSDRSDTPSADDIVAYLPDLSEDIQAAALARGLTSYGRYLHARDRHAGDTTLASMLQVTLRAGTGNAPAGAAAIAAVPPLDAHDGIYSLTPDHWIWVEIRVLQPTRLRLQVGWVMFSDDGNVVPLWPIEGSQPSLPQGSVVFVGFDRESSLSLTKRDDQRTSLYTLAVIASTGPVDALPLNLASLTQQSVQAEFADVIARARGMQQRGEPIRRTATQETPAWYAWNLRIAING
jgi:hypothetical protein